MTGVTMVMPADEPYSPAAGAVATVGDAIARALLAVGVDLHVVAPTTPGRPYAGTLHQVRATRALGGRALARTARAVGRPLRPDDVRYRTAVAQTITGRDVIVHNDPAIASALAREGHRTVLWLHNLVVDRAAVRDAVEADVRLIAISHFVREWTAKTHDIAADQIAVVYNTVDTDVFHPPAVWAPTGRLRAVIHGRIDPGKGQLLAARAVALARSRGVPVDLTVIGPVRTFGMPRIQVDRYIRDLRTALDAAAATWDGPAPRSAIPDLLRQFDVSMAPPTVGEPFSLAALEGMSSGCATLAVPVGGLLEVIGDAARTCAPTADDLAEALGELAGNHRLLAEYRERAVARAQAFAWPGAASQTIIDHFG